METKIRNITTPGQSVGNLYGGKTLTEGELEM